jgi:hypothetical protein
VPTQEAQLQNWRFGVTSRQPVVVGQFIIAQILSAIGTLASSATNADEEWASSLYREAASELWRVPLQEWFPADYQRPADSAKSTSPATRLKSNRRPERSPEPCTSTSIVP